MAAGNEIRQDYSRDGGVREGDLSSHLPRSEAEVARETNRCWASIPEGESSLGDICRSAFRKQPNLFLGLCKGGFDYTIVEDLKGCVVKLHKFAKYAQILKNSMA